MTEYKVGDRVRYVCGDRYGEEGVLDGVHYDGPNNPRMWNVLLDDGRTPASVESYFELVPAPDPVSHPPHYTAHPSGIECIQVTEHMGFLLGNTIKYIWRADLKQDAIEDLKKARWYLDREIQKRETA